MKLKWIIAVPIILFLMVVVYVIVFGSILYHKTNGTDVPPLPASKSVYTPKNQKPII